MDFSSSSKIRVAFVTILPSPYQVDLFRALARQPELDLRAIYLEEAAPDSPWPETERAPYEEVLPGFWVGRGPRRWHVNWPLADLDSFDVVVLSSYMSTTGQWLMRRGLKGKPWLFWAERMREQPRGWRSWVQRFVSAPLSNADGIVGMGSLAEADYRRRFPNVRHANIPYHCDLEGFYTPAGPLVREGGGSLTFLCCGQMIHRKGIDVLLRAFDRLVRDDLDVRLLLVGREAELPVMMENVGESTRSRIDFRGFRPPDELPVHFADADVFVLPSRHDGWGVVVNQALGAGLPLICSDAVGAAHDLIDPGVNGRMVEAGSVDALHRAMQQLAEAPEKARRWGEASLKKSEQWHPEAGARKWVEVLEEVVRRHEDPVCQ